MNIVETIILAIVEGLTEFLPVSSTGHMIIAQNLMGIESTELVKAFTVIIQFGAILSVVILYWKNFFRSWDFYWKLLIAFLPAAVIGFLFSETIDALLENVWVVAAMLILGGVFMLYVDKLFDNPATESQKITEKKALYIGLFQCIAMIPGVSRSMATIVGGMAQNLTRQTAAEFSFFLAVPTMFAASAWKVYELLFKSEGNGLQILADNLSILIIGNIIAFIVALAAIRFFIGYVTRYGFKAFGLYRIIVGSLIILLLLLGYNLQIVE
ncbi:MAG: undecaprenyl-diphosphate phosphatase [Dysgonamonadaceae bacterium]|jgi:undecaprenyl-diphosphatase|nr:undecaprenyl-diphosphate phosphatase [Dysgonamonadaceae bacterium]